MNKKSNTALKTVLFAGIAAAAVSSTQAQIATSPYVQGGAFAAFTSNTGNDLIINLGLESSLYNGQTWDLGSLLTGNVALANSPTWSVLAADSGNIYTTVPHAYPAPGATSDFFGAQGAVNSIGQYITTSSGVATPAASATFSFSTENNAANPQTYLLANEYGVVGGAFSGSSQIQDFYSADNASDPATKLNPGQFTLTSAGLLTYGVVAAPEPASYTLAAFGGIMVLVLRRRFSRNA